MGKRVDDLTGKKFGKLTGIIMTGRNSRHQAIWLFKCDCGNEKKLTGAAVKAGGTSSCGCIRIAQAKMNRPQSKIRKAWYAMRQRCSDPTHKSYPDYGGRGIKVCERWNDFQNFAADMGEPLPHQSIDRIDVNGNYEPSNCRWADIKTQNMNKRSNHLITHNGKTQCIQAWANELSISRPAIVYRIKRGLNIETRTHETG